MATTKITSDNITDGAITSAKLASGVGGVAGIVSSADATAITIDSSERVGIGTVSPSEKLTIQSGNLNFMGGTNDAQYIKFGDTGDDDIGNIFYYHGNNNMVFTTNTSEAMRIDSNGNLLIGTTSYSTGAFGSAFGINISATRPQVVLKNETYSTDAFFGLADNLWLGTQDAMNLIFATNDAERMRIDSDGDVRIGTTGTVFSSGERMSIYQSDGQGLGIKTAGDTSFQPLALHNSWNTGTRYLVRMNVGSGGSEVVAGNITCDGTTTIYGGVSDYRLKENIIDMADGATAKLKSLRPVSYNMIVNPDITVDGFIAHEVDLIVPQAVVGEKDAVDNEGNPEYQNIDNGKLVPLLVKTIQELEARITTLENA